MKNNYSVLGIILIGLFVVLLFNCKKEDRNIIPIITLVNLSDTTGTSVDCNLTIIADGGEAVVFKGVCWNTTGNPTITDGSTAQGGVSRNFLSSVKGLMPFTKYYIRGYATNSTGTGYSNELTFITLTSAPLISTTSESLVGATSMTSGAEIISNGGLNITASGVCWNTSTNPTIDHFKTIDGTGTGKYTSHVNGLSPNTQYYLRSYATNSLGTSYGSQVTFKTTGSTDNEILFNPALTYGTVSDIDGNVYKTIQIGTKTWMAENLKTTKYRNGDLITNVTDDTAWKTQTTGAYCWYNNDIAYKKVYGALYNWHAVNDPRGLAPAGWHVATDAEWIAISNNKYNLVFISDIREIGTGHWKSAGTINNKTGFTALPGGRRIDKFQLNGSEGYWWCADQINNNGSYRRIIDIFSNTDFGSFSPWIGQSVRCVKD